MNEVFSRIVSNGTIPSRADIAELLASIGKPGEKREQKIEAVRQLFEEAGHHGRNFQGFHYLDDPEQELSSYEAY